MKNILLVSYYFPPYAGISARTAKYCKFLPEFDWNPIVLTVDSKYYGKKVISDDTESRITIYRIPYIKLPFSTIILKLFFPFLILFYVIRYRNKIDAVYLTGSPYHPFIMTSIITGFMKIPTILDFRDSWSINHGFDGKKKDGIIDHVKEKVFGMIEKISIYYASSVIFSTYVLQKEYELMFPEFRYKFHTITNGFDPDDFNHIIPEKLAKTRTVIITGAFGLYTPDVVEYLIQSLKNFPELTFIYVGNEHDNIIKISQKYKVQDQVLSFEYQPYKKTLSLLAGADYCIVSTGLENGLGTKIFDYLALSKPVLCFIPENSIISKMLGHLDNIIVCNPGYTLEKVSNSLRLLMGLCSTNNSKLVNKFTRKEATRMLANLLSEISQ